MRENSSNHLAALPTVKKSSLGPSGVGLTSGDYNKSLEIQIDLNAFASERFYSLGKGAPTVLTNMSAESFGVNLLPSLILLSPSPNPTIPGSPM